MKIKGEKGKVINKSILHIMTLKNMIFDKFF